MFKWFKCKKQKYIHINTHTRLLNCDFSLLKHHFVNDKGEGFLQKKSHNLIYQKSALNV